MIGAAAGLRYYLLAFAATLLALLVLTVLNLFERRSRGTASQPRDH